MGFFGSLFGGKKETLPALDPASPAAQQVEKFRSQFEALTKKIDDRFEAVPAQNALYVFLGNPPGMFGIVWFLEGDTEEHNMKKLMAKKGLTQRKIDNLMQKLRTEYSARGSEARFSVTVGGKSVIVVPSDGFANNLYTILHVMDE